MGREIRRVPVKWEHPKKKDGEYESLSEDYVGSLKYYRESVAEFSKWMKEVITTGKVKIYDETFTDPKKVYDYLTEDGQIAPPNIHDYMPNGTWYQLYQNVSEGTPLSPPFKTKKELVKWLSENKDFWGHQWSKEAARDIVGTGFAMSGIMANGRVYRPEEQYLLKD